MLVMETYMESSGLNHSQANDYGQMVDNQLTTQYGTDCSSRNAHGNYQPRDIAVSVASFPNQPVIVSHYHQPTIPIQLYSLVVGVRI